MSLSAFFARELAPSHRRIVEAARTATKATLTTGLATIMQTLGPFGPLFAFRIGQPGISFGFLEGAVTIGCAAAMQAAIVPTTGKLLDYPGLILAFLFAVFAAIAYLLSNTRLFLPLALVAVATITIVYVGIFEPGEIGWGSTYTFDGIVVATLVMVAIDTFIWPSPQEPRLLESIAADLTRTRRRFELVGRRFLDPFTSPLPAARAESRLAPTLTLLNSVEEHTKPTPQRLAALLDAIMTCEHAYLEVERLAVLADEPRSESMRQKHAGEIDSALKVLDEAFAKQSDLILAGLPEQEETPQWATDLRTAIQRLNELTRDGAFETGGSTNSMRTSQTPLLGSAGAAPGGEPEILNLLGFADGLVAIANLLQPRERPASVPPVETTESEHRREAAPIIDQARLRFSIKLGATITLGLLVGLTTQRADLQTILWSIAVAGQPNQYGAVIRKTILRLVGCIIGGLAALAAMIIVSENFDSLPPYLIAIFAVIMFSTYLSQSSEWLAYAGIQTGITFLICYVGLAPASDVYRPLWRFWGIVLGVLTTGFVFLFLWPEYAGDKVIQSLSKLTRSILVFAKDVVQRSISEAELEAVERRISTNLLELLNMADQARLEGRRGSLNSAAAVEAAAILLRIAYCFRTIARHRPAQSELNLPHNVRERYAMQEREYCAALELQLQRLESTEPPQYSISSAPALTAIEHIASNETAPDTDLLAYFHISLAPQIEAYRRLSVLLQRLDTVLSKIAVG